MSDAGNPPGRGRPGSTPSGAAPQGSGSQPLAGPGALALKAAKEAAAKEALAREASAQRSRPAPGGTAAPGGSGPRPALGGTPVSGSSGSRPALKPAAGASGERVALGSMARTASGSHPVQSAPSLASAPPRPSQVMSAARAQPVSSDPGDLKQKLKAGAENTALNVVGAARDSLAEFTRTSIYFKYKVLIAVAWVLAMSGTFFVACPTNPLAASNDLGAVLVIAGDKSRPVFMVKNEGEETWRDVLLVVDKQYRAASPEVAPGGNFTITPKQLVGPNATLAPPDLQPRHMELRTSEGDELLMEDGEPQ